MHWLAKTLLVGTAGALFVCTVQAKEVPAGTVLSKSNIDSLLTETLDGKPIKSLLTERMDWMIRNAGMALKLSNAKAIEVDPKWAQATEKNAAGVQFDPSTRTISGWKGGLPFPRIDPADPYAGDKVAWNARYGLLEGYTQEEPYVAVYLVDFDKGIERIQNWAYRRVIMNGRVGASSTSLGDGSLQAKTLTFLTYPLDIRGIGVYAERHADASKVDDKWVYVNQFRRTKRVSGGGWMDPLGGGVDILVEDLNVWDTPPNWYPKVKLIGKRWMLAVAHAEKKVVDYSKKRTPEELPYSDLKNAPYYNTLNAFEPREFYELEVTPANEHPYGKRVVYIDAQLFQAFAAEIYDKKGDFWKYINYEHAPATFKDGFKGYVSLQGRFIDFKRRHATIFGSEWIGNDPAVINEKTISAESLEREAAK